GTDCAIAFSPNGTVLAADAEDATVRLWDMATGKIQNALPGHDGPISSLMFSENGKNLVSGSEDKTIRFWEVKTGKEVHRLNLKERPSCFYLTPDATGLVTRNKNHSLSWWDIASGKEVKQFAGPKSMHVRGLAITRDGKTLYSGGFHGPI